MQPAEEHDLVPRDDKLGHLLLPSVGRRHVVSIARQANVPHGVRRGNLCVESVHVDKVAVNLGARAPLRPAAGRTSTDKVSEQVAHAVVKLSDGLLRLETVSVGAPDLVDPEVSQLRLCILRDEPAKIMK